MAGSAPVPVFWHLVGIVAGVLFYGRFVIQWIISELQRRSVIPVVFWYLSISGSLLLLTYAIFLQSPVGALSHCFNMIVYSRNLVLIWREKGWLTPRLSVFIHSVVALVVLLAVLAAARVWLHEYHLTQNVSPSEMRQTWFWIFVGVAGQSLFACRFLIQWLVSDKEGRSVVPLSFWYLSIAASTLLAASHIQRNEWVFAIGVAATVVIYARNIYLVQRYGKEAVAEE